MNKKMKGLIDTLDGERRSQESRLNYQSNVIGDLYRRLDGLIEYLEVEMIHYPERNVFVKKDTKEQA